jgi:acylphosphatase
VRLSINFQGRVQGVGFRATARDVVQRQPPTAVPLTGWVRNEPDGSVQMELQGEPAAVEAALAELHAVMGRKITQHYRSEMGEIGGEVGFVIAR